MTRHLRWALGLILIVAGALAPASPAGADAWSAPAGVSQASTDAWQPQVAVDSQGRVHTVWSDGEGLYHRVFFEGAWSPPVRVMAGASPDLAADGRGRVYAAFARDVGGAQDIFVAAWEAPGGWGPAVNVSDTPKLSQGPSVAASGGGRLAVVWSESQAGGAQRVYLAESADGQTWSVAPVPSGTGILPVVALSSSGAVQTAWQDVFDVGLPMEIYYTERADGVWSLPVAVSDSPQAHSTRPAIATWQGHVYLAWQESTASGETVRTGHRTPDGVWMAPQERASSGAERPSLSVDVAGGVHLAWAAAGAVTHVRAEPGASAWGPVEQVAAGYSEVLEVGTAARRGTHIVWSARPAQGALAVWHSAAGPAEQATYSTYLPLARR